MKYQSHERAVQGVSRREMIKGVAAAVVTTGSGTKLFAGEVGSLEPMPPHEPNANVFKLLTLWIAATNSNANVSKLDDATLKLMGLDPNDFGKVRAHVLSHPALYDIIRQEFSTFESVYAYNPGQCPSYADTLQSISKLTAP